MFVHMYLCNRLCTMGLYVQGHKGQSLIGIKKKKVTRWSCPLLLPQSSNVWYSHIYSFSCDTEILCIVFQQNVNLWGIFYVWGKDLQSKKMRKKE